MWAWMRVSGIIGNAKTARRRCIYGELHLCISILMKTIFIPEQSGPARQKTGRALRRRARKWPALPWKPNTQHVNNVIYRCHLEKIGPGCRNCLSTDMWGGSITIFICTAKLSRWMGLCSGGLRVNPKQTHILKQDLEYNLDNNGFTRRGVFSLFHKLSFC